MSKLISIIVNCYNGEKYLNEALESIIKQDYKNWELIFWDNCSTDKSKEIFKKFEDLRFKYFLAPKHTTLYQARNLAIKKAISFLKDDDILIIAGKGHEQTQTIGIETLPFDDVSVVKNTLDRLNP